MSDPLAAVPRIPRGIGPPMVLPIPLTALPTSEGGTDLTTVTAIAYRVRDPNGIERTTPATLWPGVIESGATPTSLGTHFVFTGSDFDTIGRWRFAAVGTVPGGTIDFEGVNVDVVAFP